MGELSVNNSIAHLLSHASQYSSQLLPNLKANAFRAVSTGLTGLALTVAVLGTAVTHSKMYEAGVDFYALE